MIHFVARWWWVIATILFLASSRVPAGRAISASRRFRRRRKRHVINELTRRRSAVQSLKRSRPVRSYEARNDHIDKNALA
jgi:hypothetical protein